jgi:hypothetical protein
MPSMVHEEASINVIVIQEQEKIRTIHMIHPPFFGVFLGNEAAEFENY